MFIGTCKLRWQEFTSHLMETQSWFSLLLLFELFVPHFVTYWSDYWGFSHHPVAWCEFMSFCVHMLCSLHPRWVSDPLRDDSPFSQICGDRTVNWTLFLDSLKPLRAVLDTIHATLHYLDQFWKSLSLDVIALHFIKKKKIYWKSDLGLWVLMTAKEKCRIYCLHLQPDFRSNCCRRWRWVSSYKPVLHINYLIRRSQ